MQVTTGRHPSRSHILFWLTLLGGLFFMIASIALIWLYRSSELNDLRGAQRLRHERFASLILRQSALWERTPEGYDALVGSLAQRAQLGAANGVSSGSALWFGSRAQIPPPEVFMPSHQMLWPSSADFFRARQSLPLHRFVEIHGSLVHVSLWAIPWGSSEATLELFDDLGEEISRINQRANAVAISALLTETLFLAFLLWLARRGDERLQDSEKEHSAMESELFFLAHYDTITHLPNRSLFWERFDAAIARAERLGKAVCLLVFDLQGFRLLNEIHGRATGDAALIECSRRIQASSRASDLVSRIGADEFAVLLEDLDLERSSDAAARFLDALSRHNQLPWTHGPLSIPLDLIGGGARFPLDGQKSEELLAVAQHALQHAQSQGLPFSFHPSTSATSAPDSR